MVTEIFMSGTQQSQPRSSDGTYSKTQLLINSLDRKAGTPAEYYVELQPKLRNVVGFKFNKFSGGAFPYTFKKDILYTLTAGHTIGGAWTYRNIEINIPRGLYNLFELINLMNTYFYFARIRFDYSQLDRRVKISKVQYYYDADQYLVTAVSSEGQNVLVDRLLGFPRGWAIGPELGAFGVISSYAVQPQFLPSSLMISFSNFPSKVVSSSGIIGELAIPYTPRTFDYQSNRIEWSENSEFESIIQCYAEYVDHLGIRIVDSQTGEKYQFMEEHTIQVEIIYSDVMYGKPYPNNDSGQ